MKFLNGFIFIFILNFQIFAQTSLKSCFKTNVLQGCTPLKIQTLDCSGADPSLILYDFGAGEGIKIDKEYTYTKAGKYFITQYINSNGGGGVKSDGTYMIEVIDAKNPQFITQSCENLETTILVTDNAYDRFLVDFGDGKSEIVTRNIPKKYTYSDNKPKTISVSGYFSAQQTCGMSTETITPIDRIQPANLQQLEVLDNGNAKLTLQTEDLPTYTLFLKSTNVQNTSYILPKTNGEYVISNIDAKKNSYEFYVSAFDNCTSRESRSLQSLPSFYLNAIPDFKKNVLIWNPTNNPNFISYNLYKNDQLLRTFKQASLSFFEDVDVKCGQSYCYRLETILYNGIKSLSAKTCITANSFSNPKPLTSIHSTVEKESIKLSWILPTSGEIKKMRIEKTANNNKVPSIEIETNATSYEDKNIIQGKIAYCYQIIYTDECGNESLPSSLTCPMLLNFTKDLNDVRLAWVSNDQTLFDYYIEKLDEKGNVYWTSAALQIKNFTFSKKELAGQNFYFRIKAVIKGRESVVSYSNVVVFMQEPQLIYPNAFSPNHDGLNDEFRIKGIFISKFKIQIFDRWGNVVYLSEDINQTWDGRLADEYLPTGVYAFLIEALDREGQPVIENGMIHLIR